MESFGDVMGFDRALTLFNPEGELLQVNYARKSVDNGKPTIAISTREGIVFSAIRPVSEDDLPLIVPESAEKVFKIDEDIATAISGFISDGRILVDKLQEIAQNYRIIYGKEADILLLVKDIASEMQAYTQYGGARPFAVGLLIGGVRGSDYALYVVEPGGTYYEYKAVAIGMEKEKINKILKNSYDEKMSLEDGIELSIKSLRATSIKLMPENLEIVTVKKGEFKKFSREEVKNYL
ncbi:MAG: archaeal proteasome endopeptidase complex subunit alpha [Candidatus Rehaiarchaeum fermentans]|nr:archaeal proteasome endopeptidase complex subunit alpha [Candidatus Rehaiarchaeum fermentans]MCW1293569.1 archaeal proteasome endopeptidase complex subunit alpha [Candidatus Rehaiarchaeum fermentans]MCW1311274.1 archaeal proteasome endopeptidase complex subunit alpha [Candidatus Rehaiarchaeum fermentans]